MHILHKIFQYVISQGYVALDCETTGFRAYHGDAAFGVSIATIGESYYFLVSSELIGCLKYFFANYNGFLFFHNAKFDMTFFKKMGCDVFRPNIFCSYADGRLVNSDLMTYSLDALAKPLGYKKDDGVKKYMNKHKLYVMEQRGKKRRKKYFFDKVPYEIMEPYARKDAEITLQLANHQLKILAKKGEFHVAQNEARLTKTFFRMEQFGVKINRDYVQSALQEQLKILQNLGNIFSCSTDMDFKDHVSTLHKAFTRIDCKTKVFTKKGQPSYDKHALAEIDHPLARLVESYREAHSRATTYENILYFADSDDVLHANVKQAGCATGRVSYTDPALQCIEKNDDEEVSKELFYLRASFIPRPGYFFVAMDYDQFEYRMMLNYAEEMSLINSVKSGLDVHTATAKQVGINRKQAKTMNFMLLYGGGAGKLAANLKIPLAEAQFLRHNYFAKLPKVKRFIDEQIYHASRFQELKNWFGRRYTIPRNYAYIAPNYCIQGGCADWVKIAMNQLDDFLLPKRSRMLLQIHDELLFEVHESEENIIPDLKAIMENVSHTKPHTHLKYTVGVEYSNENWHLKREWKGGREFTEAKID